MEFKYIRRWVQKKIDYSNSYLNRLEISGIYFLMKDHKCVYIGQSKNIFVRLNKHRYSKDYDYSLIYQLDANNWSYIDKVEKKLIRELQPILNINHK
jgi:hypothetical protein